MKQSFQNIAVLMDADNASACMMDSILTELSTYGRITIKKAFGNWKSHHLKPWEQLCLRFGIQPIQQFSYVTGKNSTDIAMVIAAMDLLYAKTCDAVALISSDSDFTPIAIRLREAGIFVFGVGKRSTPLSFRYACEKFLYLEQMPESTSCPMPATVPLMPPALPSSLTPPAAPRPAPARPPQEPRLVPPTSHDDIHQALYTVWKRRKNAEGDADFATVNAYLISHKLSVSDLGYSKTLQFLQDFPDRYRIRRNSPPQAGQAPVVFSCIE